ncbi:MAG: hypothetical protein WCS70_07855 [Verrucomicrobiota bacterium]
MKLSLAVCLLVAPLTNADTCNFDHAKAGELPAEWVGGVTGNGTAKWSVESDATAPSKSQVLKQSGAGTFLWCVLKDVALTNGAVAVNFKAVTGTEDQAGGVVWRFQDGDNYYVCRANALENNVRIYHVVKGRRVQFGGVNAKVTGNKWHTLRVEFAGAHFKVHYEGRLLFEADDKTFTTAGKVGVWTKADSCTAFDDFGFEN